MRFLTEHTYKRYEKVCAECKERASLRKPFPRARVAGLRASAFGDVIFLDHADVSFLGQKGVALLILDAATPLLWGTPQ